MPAICYLDIITQRGWKTKLFPYSTPSQSSVSTDSLLPILDLGNPPYLNNNTTLQMKWWLAAIFYTLERLTITHYQQKEFYWIFQRLIYTPLNY